MTKLVRKAALLVGAVAVSAGLVGAVSAPADAAVGGHHAKVIPRIDTSWG